MAIKIKDGHFSLRMRKEVILELRNIAHSKNIRTSELTRWVLEKYLVEECKVRF